MTGSVLKLGGRRKGRGRTGVLESLERVQEKSHWGRVLVSLPWMDPVK